MTIVSTLILWTPFISTHSFDTVLRHWDGPLYIIPAKTLYNMNDPLLKGSVLGLSPTYFAAHLPGYPLTIRALAPFVGYPYATVISTLLTSILLFWAFYYICKKLRLTSKPLFLTLVFIFLTPRFFVIHSVGSPEPLLMLGLLLSVYFFTSKRYFLSGLFGAMAVITKSPGILLWFAYLLFFAIERLRHKKIPRLGLLYTLLIPIGLLGVFTLYHYQYGDFLEYFHSGVSLNLTFPPYQVFNSKAEWVGTGWLEEVLFVYFIYGYALVELLSRLALHIYRSENPLSSLIQQIKAKFSLPFGMNGYSSEQDRFYAVSACFTLIFYGAIISIAHRDVSRYSLPLLPFVLITFEKFLTSKKFQLLLLILLPAIYMYAWNFMGENVMPNIDWTPFL